MYAWNAEKNTFLKQTRGIGFEEAIEAINDGKLLDVYDHPNQECYPGQKIYVVEALGYVYLVPFVKNGGEIFLKTLIPSRKARKLYPGASHA
ncbi:MAG: BrnT family toxin [Sulfuricellaceae bacterium]